MTEGSGRTPRWHRSSRRVGITGVGLITPLGVDRERSWDGLVAGRSGITEVTNIDVSGEKVRVAGEVKDAEADVFGARLPSTARARIARFVRFAYVAATEAIEQAGAPHRASPDRWGVVAGVGIGVPHPAKGYRVGPTSIIRVMPNAVPAWIAILEGLRGPNMTVSSACASGAHAIGVAFDQIRLGRADGMVAGGVDTVITPEVLRAYYWMRALNGADEPPEKRSRPFDATRRGFVLGEGAAFFVLEALDAARSRGAEVVAELIGWGMTSDAHSIVATGPEGEGMARSMEAALTDAGLRPEEVGYISAHGTSTPMNDRDETKAIRRVFGVHADRLAVSSQKSMIGHTMGAAGAVEAAVTALTLQRGVLTPTINLHHPDPECDLDYVPNESRRASVSVALSNSFGFGGHNCTLAMARSDR